LFLNSEGVLMNGMRGSRTRSRKPERRRAAPARKRSHAHDSVQLSKGAAAAELASAGIGTRDAEPADWLFGDSLSSVGLSPR
jgi:hypothetical protein